MKKLVGIASFCVAVLFCVAASLSLSMFSRESNPDASSADLDLPAERLLANALSLDNALNHLAPQHPDQKFAIIDVDFVLHPNVVGFVYAEEEALADIENGAFVDGAIRMSMADGSVDYSNSNPALSSSVIAQVDHVKEEIVNGNIRVYSTYREALAVGVVPAGLMRLTTDRTALKA